MKPMATCFHLGASVPAHPPVLVPFFNNKNVKGTFYKTLDIDECLFSVPQFCLF